MESTRSEQRVTLEPEIEAQPALTEPTTTADDLPTRPYIRVRPTAEPLSPPAVEAHLLRLYALLNEPVDRTWYHRPLRRLLRPPTVECLLASTGRPEVPLDYYFGCDDTSQLDGVERTLRALFPDSYEFERVEWHPDHLLAATVTGPLPETDTDGPDPYVAAVEFRGCAERHNDWQTRLKSFTAFQNPDEEGTARVPLAAVVETMAETRVPMLYQVLIRPKRDWTRLAQLRRDALMTNRDTTTQIFLKIIGRGRTALSDDLQTEQPGQTDTENHQPSAYRRIPKLSEGHQERLDELATKDARSSFAVNARAVAIAPTNVDIEVAQSAIEEVASALSPVSHTSYTIRGVVTTDHDSAVYRPLVPGSRVLEHIRTRRFRKRRPIVQRRLPWTHTAYPVIVVDSQELPNFCLLDGTALTAAGDRAVSTTPGERTALPRPPFEQLTAYRGEGLVLGKPLTQDGTPDAQPLVLPPALQSLHVGWFGKTGSGKSTSLINAILGNHAATQGVDILIDPKGDGMGIEYLRAHYATYGTLENVHYFNCANLLPAFSFFDIRDQLDADVPRTTAVEDTVDHYIEILTQIMGQERFDQAVRSPDVIRYLVKAMFDPVNGYDAFSHRELHGAARRMHERQAAPAVADPDLERMLAGVVANRAQSFDEIMQGVANRMEKIPVDRRLARVFNHVPEEGDSHFDLADYLNKNAVIVFDTGELRTESQRVLTLVILSNLWTALRRRSRRTDGTQPLVNLYIEEAASVAVSGLLKELLAQSRGFDCSVTLSMQFPAQLRSYGDDVYDEVLNNISTFVTGNVPVDRRLAERLATDEMDPQAVGNRLRALRRGQWLVSLPAAFDAPEPRPFLVGSMSPPPGDPAGDAPLTPTADLAFRRLLLGVYDRTLEESGLILGSPSVATHEDESEDDQEHLDVRVDSALPHTKRMPPTVSYSGSSHALQCTDCGNRYDPDIEGIKRAVACCSSLAETDRDDIPICDLNLKLTPKERAASEWTDHQLMFLQAVYNGQQLRYDPLEYDLLHDSMLRLQEYIGIESEPLQDLIKADLLRHDTDHPHRLYTVTPDGRNVIGEGYRQGVDYGHGAGDLEESSQHVFAVEVATQYLERNYVEDPDSSVTEVIPYYDLDDQHRLDIAGLDSEGEIVVAVEAERVNHDVLRAVPDDFDKIAACDVEEAIWVVMTQSEGHAVLQALNNPPEGEPRVEKTYAKTTPPQQFRIDTPGLTAMYPAEWLRDRLDDS